MNPMTGSVDMSNGSEWRAGTTGVADQLNGDRISIADLTETRGYRFVVLSARFREIRDEAVTVR